VRDIPDELTHGPFTVSRGSELGLSLKVMSGRRFRSPWPGVRVVAEAPDTYAERCRAASLILPVRAAFSHDTAVALGGWLVPRKGNGRPSTYRAREPDRTLPIHVSVPSDMGRPRVRGMIGHRVDPAPGDVVVYEGMRITSGWRTWCDLAANGASDEDLVIFADALRQRFARGAVGMLTDRLEAWGRGRGAKALRLALSRSRDGVDSPMETRLRLMFVDAGLPEPEVNQWVRHEDGSPLHKPDLSWPRWRVAADYDGQHHADRDREEDVRAGRASDWRLRQDTASRELLEGSGWQLRVFTSFDVFRRRDLAVERMRTALRRGGAPV
jgi:hypothetical protein